MDTGFIVVICLLVLIVLAFLSILVVVAVGVAKVTNVVRPITRTIRTIRKVANIRLKRRPSKTKAQHNELVKNMKNATKRIRTAIASDLKAISEKLKTKLPRVAQKLPNIAHLIMSGINELCLGMTALWADHVSLTYYYGTKALQPNPTCTDQDKMAATAEELMSIQRNIASQVCGKNPTKLAALTKLLEDHISIVAQIATEWRKNPSGGFDGGLVQKWYDNANQTVQLLNGDANMAAAYKQHLDDTAAYLTGIAKKDEEMEFENYDKAVGHALDLAQVFCQAKCD
jgi:hypothetical protein